MSCYVRLNQFVLAANQAYYAPKQHYLVADRQGLGVSVRPVGKSITSEMKNENKQTWKQFRESLIETIGRQKFDWICQRYRKYLNFTQVESTGQPLLAKHVELFGAGSSQLFSHDVKARFVGKLRTLNRAELQERIRMVQPFPVVGEYINPVEITGAPQTRSGHFFHDKVLMDKEKQLLFSDAVTQSFPSWLERFAKVTVNRELIEGQIIPVPGQDGQIDYYKIYRKVTTGDGLVAYALKPATRDSTLKPMIVFRPSQFAFANEDAFETYLNDVQPHVGEMGWIPSKKIFDQLMNNDRHFRRDKEKISIAGYSLGGAHAQRFLEEYYEQIAHVVTYNSPSVEKEVAERFAHKLAAMPHRAEPLNIQIFRTKRDICHYVGEKHVGWGVNHPDVTIQLLEIDHENKKAAAFSLHAHRIFDNIIFPYHIDRYEKQEELFNHLDNSQRGADVLLYEKWRILAGGAAFIAFKVVSKIVKITSRLLGIKILRSSRDPN